MEGLGLPGVPYTGPFFSQDIEAVKFLSQGQSTSFPTRSALENPSSLIQSSRSLHPAQLGRGCLSRPLHVLTSMLPNTPLISILLGQLPDLIPDSAHFSIFSAWACPQAHAYPTRLLSSRGSHLASWEPRNTLKSPLAEGEVLGPLRSSRSLWSSQQTLLPCKGPWVSKGTYS